MQEIKTYGVRLSSEYLDDERLANRIIAFADVYGSVETFHAKNAASFIICFPTVSAREGFILAVESDLYKGYIIIKDVIVLEVE